MKELVNIDIADLPIILTEQTCPIRFHPLIRYTNDIMIGMAEAGITDKDTFYDRFEASLANLSKESSLYPALLTLFNEFLHTYDIKPRYLNSIKSVPASLIDDLKTAGVYTNTMFLTLCSLYSAESIARKFNTSHASIKNLFLLCDMMRLPGIHALRANLFYASRIRGVDGFRKATVDGVLERTTKYISKKGLPLQVPFPKEIASHIATAKVYPSITFGVLNADRPHLTSFSFLYRSEPVEYSDVLFN